MLQGHRKKIRLNNNLKEISKLENNIRRGSRRSLCTLVQNELHDVKLILLVSFKGLVISTATRSIVQKLGSAVKEVARTKGSSWWHTPHMAAASLAIAERIPLVDFVLEVRDSRIPLSSECSQLGDLLSSLRRVIALNKADLAKQSDMKVSIYPNSKIWW
ncbi:unnamed protein product [Coffea canephora]|uniref:G domain-containing protein n=1 Tax=Coffea canephora TaxID=49390 RepID=A0A068UM20_COFCA|nr:unnamed protein product [Coffea canephora]